MLGSFLVTRDDNPLAGFDSNKVRGLLAYLCVEADRPHPRRKLAAMLWPDFPESTALNNLRYALSNLRKVIGDRSAQPAYLTITPQEIRFNLSNTSLVDVCAFESYCTLAQENPLDHESLEKAAELHQGSFLDGFSIPDSNAYEEWLVMKREHLNRLAMHVFRQLANDHEVSGEYQQAIQYAERQLELDPWREEAHRLLMRCQYYTGQRSAALAQYEACKRELAKELFVEPESETQQLYAQIYQDNLPAPALPPSFLRPSSHRQAESPRFVSRQEPLSRLHQSLNEALGGRGQLILVTGNPGQGKTALVHEFIRLALREHVSLAAAWGNSHAYFGLGDPFLPFREILEMLTGQLEHRWIAGSISQEHAQRMWRLAPYSIKAVLQDGPSMIGTLISGQSLQQRAALLIQNDPVWDRRLKELAVPSPQRPAPPQEDLFQQFEQVLAVISQQVPLLIFVDDLQWADQSSLALLFHLSRKLKGLRILVIAAFRPVELVPTSRPGLVSISSMVNELSLLHGDILINLDELEERSLIDAYIDLEPNQLEESFRQELFRYTHGHPLFTAEMLYGMQERDDLVKNPQGEWVTSPSMSWDNLPARVEAVIAERLRQLPNPLLSLLQIASIEGEYFTGEICAKVLGVDENQVLMSVSSELERHYKLVQADSTWQVDGNRISRYRFRHILFQRYLYSQLDLIERSHLHELVGNALEAHCSKIIDEISVQLAVHFELAASPLKAIQYLNKAAHQAAKVSSFEDAITHINKALFLLKSQPESLEKDQLELDLLISLIVPLELARGFAAPELGIVCDRMMQLMNKVPLKPEMLAVVIALGSFYAVHAEYKNSLAVIPLGAKLAELSQDEFFIHFMDFAIGLGFLWLGKIKEALPHFDQLIEFYEPVKHGELRHMIGSDPCVDAMIWSSWNLWLLGYPEKAFNRSQQAIDLAYSLNDPACQASSQELSIFTRLFMKEMESVGALIQSCSAIIAQHPLPLICADFEFAKGYYQTQNGDMVIGLAGMRKGIEMYQAIGSRLALSMHLTLLAEVYLQNNEPDTAARLLQQTEEFIEETDERFYQAETLRVKGELSLLQSPQRPELAEDYFCQAIQLAQKQEAKSLELRAAISLARLRLTQGRSAEARRVLAEVYGWFTEGFNTPDMKEAQALLVSLQ